MCVRVSAPFSKHFVTDRVRRVWCIFRTQPPLRGSRFVRVLGCAACVKALGARVLRVVHVVLGVRRWLGPREKVK